MRRKRMLVSAAKRIVAIMALAAVTLSPVLALPPALTYGGELASRVCMYMAKRSKGGAGGSGGLGGSGGKGSRPKIPFDVILPVRFL